MLPPVLLVCPTKHRVHPSCKLGLLYATQRQYNGLWSMCSTDPSRHVPISNLDKINDIRLADESVIFITSWIIHGFRSSSWLWLLAAQLDNGLCFPCVLAEAVQSRRVLATTIALGPLQPLSLAGASLKVWCDGGDILATGDHCTAHFVAVSVNWKKVSLLLFRLLELCINLRDRCRKSVRPLN